jgi:hypothetical protein
MEEAIQILWTYARREPINCNGKIVIPTINQSIAAIRLIIRLKKWEEGIKNEKQKGKSKKPIQNSELDNTDDKENTNLIENIETIDEYDVINEKNSTIEPIQIENNSVAPNEIITLAKNKNKPKYKIKKEIAHKSFRFRKCINNIPKYTFYNHHTANLYNKIYSNSINKYLSSTLIDIPP